MSGAVSAIGSAFHAIGGLFSPPKAPDLQAPTALSSTPTEAQASQTAATKNLKDEQTAASTSTTLNGGQGLLDEPNTTSRTLFGN